jgi:plastocyanin
MARPNPVFVILLTATAAIVAASTLPINQIPEHIASAQNNSSNATMTTKTSQSNTTMVVVEAGGGNTTIPLSVFNPKQVEVNIGQSVMWYNPSKVAEPHTVTFALDNKTKPDLSATFAVKNSSKFTAVPPNSTSEPVIIPNKQNPSMTMILGSNAIASNPVVIDSAGNAKRLGPNAAYSVKGNEKLVNSGLIFPRGMVPPDGGSSFTLTFEKAGTYGYYCILHPWMKGKVIVK